MPAAPEWTRLDDLVSDGLTVGAGGVYGLRHRPAGAIINNKIYVTGGFDYQASAISRNTYEYDIATDSWSAIRDNGNNIIQCPNQHYYTNGANVGNKLAVLSKSGSASASFLDVFDPVAETWATSIQVPSTVSGTSTNNIRYNATCSYGGKFYSFGGQATNTSAAQRRGLIWDPAVSGSAAWTATSLWSSPAYGLHSQAIAVFGDKAYLFGGRRTNATEQAHVIVYDFINATWSQNADMPFTLSYEQAGVIGDKIYVTNEGNTYIYDPAIDSWDPTPLASLFRNTSSSGNFAGYDSDGTNFYCWCGDDNLPVAQYPGYVSSDNYHVLQRLAVPSASGPYVGAIVVV